MTNADVVAMMAAGISADTIILAIQRSTAAFDVSAQALVALKKGGVPDQVLAEMLKARAGGTGESPSTSGVALSARLEGVTAETQTLTPELRQKYKIGIRKHKIGSSVKEPSVVMVSEVAAGSAAAQAGLLSGDIVWGVANGDGVLSADTKEKFLRAGSLCAPDCLIFLYHADGDVRNGFLRIGPIENSFLPLYRPNTTTIIGYKSRRSSTFYEFGETDDDRKLIWNQAFGDDEKHPHPAAVIRTSVGGFITVTAGGERAPIWDLDASRLSERH